VVVVIKSPNDEVLSYIVSLTVYLWSVNCGQGEPADGAIRSTGYCALAPRLELAYISLALADNIEAGAKRFGEVVKPGQNAGAVVCRG